MPLDFGGGQLFQQVTAGKRFGLEAQDIIKIEYDFGSSATVTVYTVPTGKTLFLSQINLTNITNDGTINVTISYNDNTGNKKAVAVNSTEVITFNSPLVLTSGQTIKVDPDTGSNGEDLDFLAIGWEI